MTTNMEDMAPPELTNQSSLHLFGDLADSDSDNDNGEAAAVGKAVEEEPPLTPERMAGVVAQVEFYFSDANLPTDRKLLRIIKRDTPGWVPIKVFSQFRKIRAITKLMANIAISLRTSSRLEVSNDMKHVRRLAPIPNYDIGTLQKRYLCVENLPAGPTIEMVTAMFTEFGPISVVRIVARGESKGKLPSWMTNSVRMPMIGHAFVEFSDEDSATRAVQAVFDEDDPRSGLSIGRLTAPWLQSPMTTAGNTPRSTLRSRNGDPASARRDGNRDGSPTRSSPYSTPAARALHSSAHASPYTTPMQSKFSSRLAMATGSDGNGTWGRRTTSDSLAGIDESPKPGDKPPAERVPSPCERLATATPTQGGKYVAPGRRSVDPSPMKGDGSMYARNPNNPGGSPIKGVHKNDVFSLDHPGTPQRGSIGSRQPAGKPPLSITKPHAVPASAPASGGSHVQVSGTSPLQEKGAARVRVGMPKGDALSAMLAIDGSSAATAAAAAANAGGAPVTTPDGGGAETPVSDFISSIIASIPGVSSPTNFLHRGGQPGCKVTAVAAGDPSSRAAVATSGDDTQSSSGDVAAARTTPRAARSRRASQADDAIVGAVGATSGESGGEALPPGWGTVPQPGAAPMHGTPKKGGSCARQSAADGELEKHAKKDYASWAAATPMYRAESAAHGSGGGGTGSKVGAATPPYAAAAAGSRDASGCGPSTPGAPPPLGALEGGAQSQSVLISRGPDGSKGFGMGRGRALATPV